MKRYEYRIGPSEVEFTEAIFSDELINDPFKKELELKIRGYSKDLNNYKIILIDHQSEIITAQAVKEAKYDAKLASKNAKSALNSVKAANSLDELKLATKSLAKVVHSLVKYLEIVDPSEAE